MASPDVTAPVRNLAGYAQRHAYVAEKNESPYRRCDADRGPLQRSCCDRQRNSTDQAPDVVAQATPGFGGDLRPFDRKKKKPQVFRKRRGSPALRFFPLLTRQFVDELEHQP